jgi:hypothetical protein
LLAAWLGGVKDKRAVPAPGDVECPEVTPQ